ncbi:MAG: hypothetical protein K6C68_11950 [Ruminococcus sp.]|nr:hypothetical protein [Ruminococcus sp.]
MDSNTIKYIERIDKEKAFDEISELFYDHNFGTASKSEIELLMFKFLIEAMIEKNIDPDNCTINL